MKIPINNDFSVRTNNINPTNKDFAKVSSGDTFKAEISDITPDSIKLKLSDGSVIDAKSLVMPNAVIGQKAEFLVKENNNGHVQLEFLKNGRGDISESFIKNVLEKFEISLTGKNIELIKELIKNNIDLNPENVNKALFFKNSAADMNIDKILFLLKENMPANKTTVDTLNRLIDNNTILKDELSQLAKQISEQNNLEVKNKLLDALGLKEFEKADSKKLFDEIAKKLFLNSEDKNSLNELRDKLEEIHKFANESEKILKDISPDLSKTSENIKNNIEFINHIDNYKNYIQIPLMVNNRQEQCELFVFKDGKNKKKTSSKNASILISLNYAYLGLIETYIEKNEKNLNFQFRCQNESTTKILSANINKLNTLLKDKGYSIAGLSFKKLEESFTVLMDKEEKTSGENVGKRFSFDMRV